MHSFWLRPPAPSISPSTPRRAVELAGYLRRVTSADLPIGGTAAHRILTGAGACAPEIRRRLDRMNRDAYVIETQPDGALCLAGNRKDGTAFAVYRFLEEFAGVRWHWPGELGEVVPHRPSLSVGKVSIQAEPAVVWRDLGPGGALWGPNASSACPGSTRRRRSSGSGGTVSAANGSTAATPSARSFRRRNSAPFTRNTSRWWTASATGGTSTASTARSRARRTPTSSASPPGT